MIKTAYDKNKTMRLLGYQKMSVVYSNDNRDMIQDVLDARRYCTDPMSVIFDIFILGFICGKRAERTRRKR